MAVKLKWSKSVHVTKVEEYTSGDYKITRYHRDGNVGDWLATYVSGRAIRYIGEFATLAAAKRACQCDCNIRKHCGQIS